MIPSLIKAYLRLGGGVGDGACVDHAFNTTDVFDTSEGIRNFAGKVRLGKVDAGATTRPAHTVRADLCNHGEKFRPLPRIE